MRGGLPHRPGYAVVPQLEPGAVRRAMALRGMGSCRGSDPDWSFRYRTSRPRSCALWTKRNSAVRGCRASRQRASKLAAGPAGGAGADRGRRLALAGRPLRKAPSA